MLTVFTDRARSIATARRGDRTLMTRLGSGDLAELGNRVCWTLSTRGHVGEGTSFDRFNDPTQPDHREGFCFLFFTVTLSPNKKRIRNKSVYNLKTVVLDDKIIPKKRNFGE